MVIERGHKDEYRLNGPWLEACIFVVNLEQAFEVVFQMKINCGWSKAKLKMDWVSDKEINWGD
jgi:hypothetical protein